MSIQKKINIAVIGATGYTGLDLVLILSKHPKVKIKYLCATKNLGKKINYFDKIRSQVVVWHWLLLFANLIGCLIKH